MDPLPGLDAGREALRRFLAGEDDLATMQARVCALAAEAITGCDATSITMLVGGEPKTPAANDRIALDLDEVQYRSGDGPCLTAMRHRGVEVSALPSEERWPEFVGAARAAGVTAVLSTPLVSEDHVLGALNLYSRPSPRRPSARPACSPTSSASPRPGRPTSRRGSSSPPTSNGPSSHGR